MATSVWSNPAAIRARSRRPLFVEPSWEVRKPLGSEEDKNSSGTEVVALVVAGTTDIVDGEVLLAQSDNLLAEAFAFGRNGGSLGRREEESPLRILTELMDQDAETARGVAEASGGLGRGKPIDEKGAEGFVQTMRRVGRFKEAGSRIC